MTKDSGLFRTLLFLTEKILTPVGIWPSDTWQSTVWSIVYIIVQLCYFVMVLTKSFLNPEKESVENAIVLSNGGLILVVYNITILLKRDMYIELLEYVKAEPKEIKRTQEWNFLVRAGREFQTIARGSLSVLAAAILMRFIQPTVEFTYIQFMKEDKTYKLPPSMGIPTFIFGDFLTYTIETFIRFLMLGSLVGICSIFILSTLHISMKYHSLALDLEHLEKDEDEVFNDLIREHSEIIKMSKFLNEIFSPHFFSNCVVSFINCSLMLFTIMAKNASMKTTVVETPLLMTGMGQLFFLLYFGDRFLDASASISIAAYKSEWYTKSVKNQKKIQFIIMRGHRPQTLNVGNNFLVASIYLFSQICQKSWGVFNILRTTVNK